MSRSLFLRIVDAVKEHDDCFMQRSDGTRRLGLSSLQKVVSTRKPELEEQTLVPTIEEAWRRCRRCPSRDPTCPYTPNTTHTPPRTLCLRKYASTSQPMMHGISDSGAQTNDPKHAPLDMFPTQHGTNERGVAAANAAIPQRGLSLRHVPLGPKGPYCGLASGRQVHASLLAGILT
ncbi:hypothetical protein SASPL_105088 [Salvia splendens]|uniref:Uncharacterized protein n=1 Tax=Salvia splendens TaxID=180675 RepID=A0A8X8YKG0_SALSN|nr:hypothetical protein SASPL_105088 [Salvia splendens]